MVKACIFDLDGTLTDTIQTIAYYGNDALAFCGYPSIEVERYKMLVGDGAKALVERMLAEVGASDSLEVFTAVYERYCTAYEKDVLYLTTVYDGIRELLVFLKANNVKTAVLSNKPDLATQMVIQNMFAQGSFDSCLGASETRKLKPDPQGALEMAALLGVKPSECIYIGDTATDMKTGKRAGMFTVGVLWGFRDFEELSANHADLIVSHPKEIRDYYQKSID